MKVLFIKPFFLKAFLNPLEVAAIFCIRASIQRQRQRQRQTQTLK